MVCMSKGLRKGMLVSGLAGALVLSGFGGESSGLAFVGPVNVSAAELSDTAAKKLEARLVELDNKSISIHSSVNKIRSFDRVDEISRGFNDYKIQISNEILHREIEIGLLRSKLSDSESKRSELNNKIKTSREKLATLDKKAVELSKSNSVSSKKELVVVKRQSKLEKLNLDKLTNEFESINSSIKHLNLSIEHNFKDIDDLKTLMRYVEDKLSGLAKERKLSRDKIHSFHNQSSNLLDERIEVTKTLNNYTIQQEIIRKNGKKAVKTKADYKKDLAVVESMLKTNATRLIESGVVADKYATEVDKIENRIDLLKKDLGGLAYDKEMIRLESLLLDSEFSIDSKKSSLLKLDKATTLKRLNELKATRSRLVSEKSKDNDSLIKSYDSMIKGLENQRKGIDSNIDSLRTSKELSADKSKLNTKLKGFNSKESSIISKLSALEKTYLVAEKNRAVAFSREAKLFNFAISLDAVKKDLIEKTK